MTARIKDITIFLVAVLATGPLFFYLWRRFLKDPAQIDKPISKVEHAHLSIETDYHGSPLFCYDNVWKAAVHRMLKAADVVLMDLRGFSDRRRGCAWEIGQLIHSYPLDRVLFLVDDKTPMELLHQLIRDQWTSEAPTQAVIKTFRTGDRDPRDIDLIAGFLSASLQGQIQAGPNQLALSATAN